MKARSPTTTQLYTPTSENPSIASDLFTQPTQSLNITPKTSVSAGTNNSSSAFPNPTDPLPFVSYDGFYNWNKLNADDNASAPADITSSHINDDSMNNFPLPTNNFSWQHMPMDIDQDWSWFLNDAQTHTGQGLGSGALPPSVPLDPFNAQGFTGFGFG
jgi:hypothetical protein